jgi:hypothetical protein
MDPIDLVFPAPVDLPALMGKKGAARKWAKDHLGWKAKKDGEVLVGLALLLGDIDAVLALIEKDPTLLGKPCLGGRYRPLFDKAGLSSLVSWVLVSSQAPILPITLALAIGNVEATARLVEAGATPPVSLKTSYGPVSLNPLLLLVERFLEAIPGESRGPGFDEGPWVRVLRKCNASGITPLDETADFGCVLPEILGRIDSRHTVEDAMALLNVITRECPLQGAGSGRLAQRMSWMAMRARHCQEVGIIASDVFFQSVPVEIPKERCHGPVLATALVWMLQAGLESAKAHEMLEHFPEARSVVEAHHLQGCLPDVPVTPSRGPARL